ncbi:MAG: hypothetical protein GY858_04860 [Candidatus Omnitrophica bacterium]|nr:hypothetical protein [Candidatus Omnitrophota bacterium]
MKSKKTIKKAKTQICVICKGNEKISNKKKCCPPKTTSKKKGSWNL